MNPLVNTDVDHYVKDLIERHIAGEEGEARDSVDRQKDASDRREDISPPTGKEKKRKWK